jgi:hypothetical protein
MLYAPIFLAQMFLRPRFKIDAVIMIICSIVIIINSVLTLQVSTAKYLMIADLAKERLCSSTLDSLHTGVSPGCIGCAYTASGPFQ